MRKMTVVLAAALCLAAAFAGCTQGPQPVVTPPAQTAQAPVETPAAPVELTGMGQFTDKFNFNDPVLSTLYQAANVNIKWEMIPNASYNERLTIVLASNELPDIIFLPDSAIYKECYKSGIILPLTEQIANAPYIQQYEDPSSLKAAMADDGKIYGLPRNSVPRTDGFVVRKDWLDALNLTIPANGNVTVDEFTELLRAFTEDDPDGNGIDDTYGITARADNGELFPPDGSIGNYTIQNRILSAFGSSAQFEIAPAGSKYEYMNPKYSLDDPSYLNALKYTNMLWEKGYIDPNWPANSASAYKDRFQAGIAGITQCFGGWLTGWKNDMSKNFPNVQFTYIYGIKDPNGGVAARSSLGPNIYGYWTVANSSAGKEQAIINFFNYILSDEGWNTIYYGVEGYHYTVENGLKVFNEEQFNPYNSDCKSYMAMVRRSNSPNLWLSPSLPLENRDEMAAVINQCIANVMPSLDLAYTPDTASNPSYIDYKTTVSTTVSKIIIGELGPEAWQPMLEGWYAAGGEAYIAEMNEYIKSQQ